jgi:hypothetical protein
VDKQKRGRIIAYSFGGSHAERDMIEWTLTEAAIRAGMPNTAEALASERLAMRPHSPIKLGIRCPRLAGGRRLRTGSLRHAVIARRRSSERLWATAA